MFNGIYVYIKGNLIPPSIYYIYWQYSFSANNT